MFDNSVTRERLKRVITEGRIFHGYIFEGTPEETLDMCMFFIKASLCEEKNGEACGACISCRKIDSGNSEDIVFTGEDGTSVKDKDVEELIYRSMKKSFTGRRTFMIVKNADSMTLRAQNRMLKTLEEPPANMTIILLAKNSESLAQTIRSRCQTVKLFSDGIDRRSADDEEFRNGAVSLAASILMGRPFYLLFGDLERFTSSKRAAASFVAVAETFYRDILVSSFSGCGQLIINKGSEELIQRCRNRVDYEQLAAAIGCAEAASKDIASNVSAPHALKYMIFDIQSKTSAQFSERNR